jgi:hypothetical protein
MPAHPVIGLASWYGSVITHRHAPGGFPGSFHDDLEPGDDTPRPGIHDANHAGGFGGHRAPATGTARSGRSSLANVLMAGLALDPGFIVPSLPF